MTHSWRKRCNRCGHPKITDARKSICNDCLAESNGEPAKTAYACEVKSWCSCGACNGLLPCKNGERIKIINEQVITLSPDIQVELFGKRITPLP